MVVPVQIGCSVTSATNTDSMTDSNLPPVALAIIDNVGPRLGLVSVRDEREQRRQRQRPATPPRPALSIENLKVNRGLPGGYFGHKTWGSV